jgi:hypothetical protein
MESSPGLRVTVLTGADDRHHHQPLHHAIVTRARDAGLAGATVLRGCEGYGASGFVHTDRLLDAADNLPVTVIIVDTEDKVRAFLPRLADLAGITVLLDTVEVLRP